MPIPASSATSERIFSAGGLTATKLRGLLAEEKVEEILKIRLILAKVEGEERLKCPLFCHVMSCIFAETKYK